MESINSFFELFIDVWNKGIFGLNASEIIIGFIIFLIFYVLRSFFARFVIRRLRKIVKKTSIKIDDVIVDVIEGPLKFLPVVVGFFIATTYVKINPELIGFIENVNRTLITIFIFWLLHQLIVPFSFLIKNFEAKLTTALVDWTLKGLKIIVIILAIVAILELWGIKVGPVIAGLGLFGVAVALGAQDLFKNLISGIMILTERRFMIGDVIHVSGEAVGTVEQIGFQQIYGENGGPGGLFHSLRITPAILEICDDINRICPNAFVFNYSNPMQRICHAVTSKYPDLKFVGLCHEIMSMEMFY